LRASIAPLHSGITALTGVPKLKSDGGADRI
jgi:hypothetical protein